MKSKFYSFPGRNCLRYGKILKTLKNCHSERLFHFYYQGKYQAYCETQFPICKHRGTWFGPERDTEQEANEDRDNHIEDCEGHEPDVIHW